MYMQFCSEAKSCAYRLVNETLWYETETRPRRLETTSRDRLETEMSRPRLGPTSLRIVQIMRVYRRLVSASPRCILACVEEATCVLTGTVCTGSSLRLVQPVQLLDSRSHTVARLEIQNSTCRSVQDSLKRCQCGGWKNSQHGGTVVQSRADKCCD